MKTLIAYSYYPAYRADFVKFIAFVCGLTDFERLIFVFVGEVGSINPGLFPVKNFVSMQHDNFGWEFGGYQKAFDYCFDGSFSDDDSFYVLNDTVGRHSYIDNSVLNYVFKHSVGHEPMIVGEKCFAPAGSSWRMLNIEFNSWIRTCFFMINGSALRLFSGKLYQDGFESQISTSLSPTGFPSNNLCNDDLLEYINDWLFINGNEKNRWYGASHDRSMDRIIFLKKKASSILNEKYVAAVIFAANGLLLDFFAENNRSNFLYRIKRKVWNIFFLKSR